MPGETVCHKVVFFLMFVEGRVLSAESGCQNWDGIESKHGH